jgi:hypothetical protein
VELIHTKPLKTKVIHRHFDETGKLWDSLFLWISDKIILSGIQGMEAATDGWKS